MDDMLDLNPEIVCNVIAKSREFHAKEGVVMPENPGDASDDWVDQVLAEHGGDMSYAELVGLINDLEPDQQATLVAVMWLGRGDFEVEEWESALTEAGERLTLRTGEYLAATPLVADYLEEGLDQLGYSCE